MSESSLHPLSLQRTQNIFLLNGITALLGWNAVLGALDYFAYIFPGYNVYLYFPVPTFVAYAITAVLFKLITNRYSYSTIVKTGIIGLNLTMIYLMLISLFFQQNKDLGFWLLQLGGFLVGFFNNLCQLSFFGMINYFGMQTVSRFTIGTAGSGIMVMVLRIIVTAIFGSKQDNYVPILVYFSLSIAFNFFDLFLNLKLFKSKQFIDKISADGNTQDALQQSIVSDKQQTKRSTQSSNKIQNQPYYLIMWQAFRSITPFPLFIFFNYIITFMLFPSLTLAKKTDLGPVWTSIIMLLMYNIGDFLGKIVGDFRKSFNSVSITFLLGSRLIFFFTIPLMVKQFTQDDTILNSTFFVFFNQLLFGLTNGFETNGSFILSFESAPNEVKKYAGVLGGIMLQFGIMVGTFLAIPLQTYVNPDI